jgi:hypothetical protein
MDKHLYIGSIVSDPDNPCEVCGEPARSFNHYMNGLDVCDTTEESDDGE